MSFSNKIKNSFKDFYNLKRLYYTTLFKEKVHNADSDAVFINDLKFFDRVEKWADKCLFEDELQNPPLEIKNLIITLGNCFGPKFTLRWLETYIYGDKALTALDELENEYYQKKKTFGKTYKRPFNKRGR